MSVSKATWDHIKEFIDSNFNDPKRDVEKGSDGYITISAPLRNKKGDYIKFNSNDEGEPWVYYGIIGDKIELWLEFDRDEERKYKVNKLHKYLKKALTGTDYKDKIDWGRSREYDAFEYWLKEATNLEDIKKFDKNLKTFIDFFDGLIRKYNEDNVNDNKQKVSISSIRKSIVLNEDTQLMKQHVALCDNFALGYVLTLPLAIPDYQRIYCWETENVNCLLGDVFSNIKKGKKYKLGTIILHYNDNKESGKYVCDIIDGQQRLITLAILLYELGFESDLLNKHILSNKSEEYVENSASLIKEFCKKNNDIYNLRDKILDSIEFSVIVLNECAKDKKNSLDLAYTFFSNQNSKGVALSDYELLKAHHLRWMTEKREKTDKSIESIASKWDSMIEKEQNKPEKDYVRTLDTYLYRLRRWAKNKKCEESEGNYHVKREYEASPCIENIPINNKKDRKQYRFNEPIQGGKHFFNFVNHHLEKYSSFIKTKEYKTLHENMTGRKSTLCYRDVIEGLLFSYYLNFGRKNLSDALSVIMRCVLQHRYENASAKTISILQCTRNFSSEKSRKSKSEISITSELALMIDRDKYKDHCPTFFLAEALKLTEGMSCIETDMRSIQSEMLKKAEKISSELEERISKAFKGINE